MKNTGLKKLTVNLVLTAFLSQGMMPGTGFAQVTPAAALPAPGTMVDVTPAYLPSLIKGLKVTPDNPLRLNFIVDKGEETLSEADFKAETGRLIKYFLASLTVPETDLWVNLSPYEKERVIPTSFGMTEMGRDLLAQDYLLKQITASLMYPDNASGRKFWEKVYAQAGELYKTTDIPVNTFNKVWVVPAKARVYVGNQTAFVVESRLKVMMDKDYSAEAESKSREQKEREETKLAEDVLREVIIPEIEKEVNEGKNFAPLRQVYYALILATWFKKHLKESILARVYVDQNKVEGVDVEDKDIKNKIWARYVESNRQGVYHLIREEYDPLTQEVIPRKYFSGGKDFAMMSNMLEETADEAQLVRATDQVTEGVDVAVDLKLEAAADKAILTLERVNNLLEGKEFLGEVIKAIEATNSHLKEVAFDALDDDTFSPQTLGDYGSIWQKSLQMEIHVHTHPSTFALEKRGNVPFIPSEADVDPGTDAYRMIGYGVGELGNYITVFHMEHVKTSGLYQAKNFEEFWDEINRLHNDGALQFFRIPVRVDAAGAQRYQLERLDVAQMQEVVKNFYSQKEYVRQQLEERLTQRYEKLSLPDLQERIRTLLRQQQRYKTVFEGGIAPDDYISTVRNFPAVIEFELGVMYRVEFTLEMKEALALFQETPPNELKIYFGLSADDFVQGLPRTGIKEQIESGMISVEEGRLYTDLGKEFLDAIRQDYQDASVNAAMLPDEDRQKEESRPHPLNSGDALTEKRGLIVARMEPFFSMGKRHMMKVRPDVYRKDGLDMFLVPWPAAYQAFQGGAVTTFEAKAAGTNACASCTAFGWKKEQTDVNFLGSFHIGTSREEHSQYQSMGAGNFWKTVIGEFEKHVRNRQPAVLIIIVRDDFRADLEASIKRGLFPQNLPLLVIARPTDSHADLMVTEEGMAVEFIADDQALEDKLVKSYVTVSTEDVTGKARRGVRKALLWEEVKNYMGRETVKVVAFEQFIADTLPGRQQQDNAMLADEENGPLQSVDAAMMSDREQLGQAVQEAVSFITDPGNRRDPVEGLVQIFDRGYNTLVLGENHFSLTSLSLVRQIVAKAIEEKKLTDFAVEWRTVLSEDLKIMLNLWNNQFPDLPFAEFIKVMESSTEEDLQSAVDALMSTRLTFGDEVMGARMELLKEIQAAGVEIVPIDPRGKRNLDEDNEGAVNSAMAQNVEDIFERNAQAKVIVLTGYFHAAGSSMGKALRIGRGIIHYAVELFDPWVKGMSGQTAINEENSFNLFMKFLLDRADFQERTFMIQDIIRTPLRYFPSNVMAEGRTFPSLGEQFHSLVWIGGSQIEGGIDLTRTQDFSMLGRSFDAPSPVSAVEDVGGIDLNPAKMELEENGNKIDFKAPAGFEFLETTPINGFSPVIIQMTPVTNIPLLLGVAGHDQPTQLSRS